MLKEKEIQPEYHEFEEFQNRSNKVEEIRNLGVEPYPHAFSPDSKAGALQEEYAGEPLGHSEDAEKGTTPTVTIAGRVVLFRAMGKNAFGQVQDATGRIQIMCNRDQTVVPGLDTEKMRAIKFIEKMIDLGDIVGLEGNLFRTQKGELTLYVKKCTLLCKTLLPLPDKHSGLADKGVRYRKRWLDLITDKASVNHFVMRSKILQIVRDYMHNLDFMEVETPILQNIYGGAEARPFMTELNALSQEMYMRIALEIALKKLVVGGMDRIFEIGKVFRNEGIDRTHNPEFTMIELYAAYMDYNDIMKLTEELFERIALDLFGTTSLERADKAGTIHTVELKTPWKRMSMKEAIKEYGGIDVETHDDEALRKLVLKHSDEEPKAVKKMTRGKLVSVLFEETAEHQLIQPHHIIDHPIETTPLCKPHRDPKLRAEGFVERFETFILGFEFCNAYTELNDPALQRKLLENQADQLAGGNDEANPMDEEFIEAICQGMPPTGGLGIGIDRLVMLFTGVESIRDVLYFPLMRPEN